MCVFIATIGIDLNHANKKKIKNLLSHRGPDSSTNFFSKNFNTNIFFNRLAINDLSKNGNMPFFINNKKIAMVANCEIYNFKIIKNFLIKKNISFESNSDAEVIIKGYQYWGDDIFKQIKGMFTIFLIDELKDKIYIARDNLGIKPLYFYKNKNSYIFSSEFLPIIKLNKLLGIKNEINKNFSFKSNSFNFDNTSTVKKIFKFEPGTLSILNKKNLRFNSRKLFRPNFDKIRISYSEKLKKFGSLLETSIETHLISDRPVSVLLSGGIDSSLIAVMAKKLHPKINSYSINIENSLSDDDKQSINLVSKKFNIKNTLIDISYNEIMDNIDDFIDVYDDLSSFDGGFITNYLLSQKIKDKSKVILVGDGADELLAGYSWFGLSKYPFKIIPNFIKKRILNYVYSGDISFDKKFNDAFENFSETNHIDFFDKIRRFELIKQLPNNYLSKVDRSTMSNSIEARVPYLDNDLIDFCLKLNSSDLISNTFYSVKKPVEKKILRDYAKEFLPLEIINKKKKGFSISPKNMLFSNINKLENTIFDKKAFTNNYFNKNEKMNLFKDFINKNNSYYSKKKENLIWKIFITDIWYNKFHRYFD